MGRARTGVVRILAAAVLSVAGMPAAAITIPAAVVVVVAAETGYPAPAKADNLWLQACSYYSSSGNAFSFSTNGGVTAWTGTDSCSTPTQEGSFQIDTPNGQTGTGHYALWETVSPPGISIDSAWTPGCSGGCDRPYRGALISCYLGSNGYQAYYQWGWGAGSQRIVNTDGGGCPYSNGLADGTPINRSFGPTQQFGWYVECLSGGWCSQLGATLYMRGVQVGATETGSPSIIAVDANNLFYQGARWLRGGGWPIALQASDSSGVCDVRAWLNGALIQGPTSGLNRASWVQCSAPSTWIGPNVNTASYGDGTALQLSYQADNAAGNWSTSSTSTSYVDNAPVALNLSGPTDAPVTAGTQYITATATAGPSGVGSILCTVDGSAWAAQRITGGGTQTAATQIPVSGLGLHQATCYATNRAVDITGAVATSPTESWSLRIREPVSGGITFSHVVQHCRRVQERILIPAHWATVRRGQKLRRVRRRARKERKWVTTCSAQTFASQVAHVAHGKDAMVSGWFTTADGAPLGNVPVNIMTAPDNGSNAWTAAGTVTTSATGSWQATLQPGPSRLVEATYAGGPLTEPATSPDINVIVPAKIAVSITPHRVPWRGSIKIRGRLLGGYIPPDGVALRLVIRYPGSREPTDLLAFRTTRAGTFRIAFTFGGGSGIVTYPLWVTTTATESDYAFAAGASKHITVTFGLPTPPRSNAYRHKQRHSSTRRRRK